MEAWDQGFYLVSSYFIMNNSKVKNTIISADILPKSLKPISIAPQCRYRGNRRDGSRCMDRQDGIEAGEYTAHI